MQTIQPAQLAAWLAAAQPAAAQPAAGETAGPAPDRPPIRPPLLLDVREDWEVAIARLDGSLHIPMHEIPGRLHELLDAHRPIVCYCHHGMRSMQVAMFLEHRGAREVHNLVGGIDAWAQRVDPDCARY